MQKQVGEVKGGRAREQPLVERQAQPEDRPVERLWRSRQVIAAKRNASLEVLAKNRVPREKNGIVNNVIYIVVNEVAMESIPI
jgi:hypothetical protein